MSESKNMGPKEMLAEVERLKAAGELPTLDRLLEVISESRTEYSEKIRDARRGKKGKRRRV